LLSNLTDDIVTLALLVSMVLLFGLPGIFLVVWRATRPPFGIASFRWLYVAWACLLVAASVWSISRVPRYSVDQMGTDNLVRLAFLALGVFLILALSSRYRFALSSELGAGALGVFFLFSLWATATTLWSVSPAGTLYKSVEYGAMLVLIALAASLINLSLEDPHKRSMALKKLFDFNWLLLFLLTASVYLGILLWPEYAIMRDYRSTTGILGFSIQGVLPGISANGVGQLGALMGVVAFARLLLGSGSRLLYVPIFVLSLITMVITQSRSPILAFAVGVMAVLIVSRRFALLAAAGALLGAVMATQYSELAYEFMRRGQSDESITNLTGRATYWEVSLQAVQERLLEGYGAYAGGRYVLASALGDSVSTVHSLWIEILLDTGLVGLTLFSTALAVTWFWLFKLRSHAMRTPTNRLLWFECLGVMAVLSVRSVFSVSTFAWSWYVVFFGVVLVFIGVMRRQIVKPEYAGALLAQPLPAARRRGPGIRR
jgi:O-antigen ligase